MDDERFNDGEFRGTVLQKLTNIENSLNQKVNREEFAPVKSIAYGLVGLILVTVLAAILSNVVQAIVR